MDDQLELHLQRFREEENPREEEDDDLQQLLALQSSPVDANAQADFSTKQDGESSSSSEESQRSEKQESDDMKHHLMPDGDSEGRTEFPPTTNVTDWLMKIARFLENQLEAPNLYT